MPEKPRFWLVFATSLLFSLGGVIAVIIVPHHTGDGGRGGAIGTAIALLFLFINRDYGAQLFRALTREIPDLKARIERLKLAKKGSTAPSPAGAPAATLPELEKRIDALVDSMAIEGEGRATETGFLALATAIGTVFWGFGDWFAVLLLRVSWVSHFQEWAVRLLIARGFHITP
jgi:hypothetical protein